MVFVLDSNRKPFVALHSKEGEASVGAPPRRRFSPKAIHHHHKRPDGREFEPAAADP